VKLHLFGVRAIRRDGDASSTPVHHCSSSIALHLTFFPSSGCRCPPRKGSLKPRRGDGPSTPQSTSKFFSALRLHLYLTTTVLHANDHKLSRTPQLYGFPVTDSCLTSDHAWSISKYPRLAGDAQKFALPFPRITTQTTADRRRVLRWSHPRQGTSPISANTTPTTASHDEVYHTVQAISMSHEQNMHHHLIYFATTMFNTNQTRSDCSLLISIQMTSSLALPASRIASQDSHLQQRGCLMVSSAFD
jgi:hypothetical protein